MRAIAVGMTDQIETLTFLGRIFVDPETNLNYSMIWEDALSSAPVFGISAAMASFSSAIYSVFVV